MRHCHLSHSNKPHIFAILLLPFKLNFTCLLDRYVNWSQGYFGINDPNTQFYIGNQYCKFWKNINEVRALSPNVSFVLSFALYIWLLLTARQTQACMHSYKHKAINVGYAVVPIRWYTWAQLVEGADSTIHWIHRNPM